MGSEDDHWYTAYAMSTVQNKMFFVIIEKGISAMIENCKIIKLGSFYEVKYAHNSSARPDNRAQHLITQYRPIAPLAEAVVNTDEMGRKHVTVTTTAKCIGMVNSKGHQVAKLYNDTFGNFIDLKNVVKDRNKVVEFEFKSIASPADQYSSVFVPVRVLNYHDMPEEPTNMLKEPRNMPEDLTEVVGVVCQELNGSTYLWSKQLDRDAFVDGSNWPQERDMSGYWVKAAVDKTRNCVVGPVERIADIFAGRMMDGSNEILVSFRYRGFSDDKNCRTFEHTDFPCIFDTRNKVQYTPHDVFYTGWLQHQRIRGNNGFWFVSHQQPMVTPRDNYERPESRSSDRSSFQPTYSVNGDSQRWNNDSNHYGSQSFEPRQQGANSSNNIRERSRTSSRVQTTSDEESEREENSRREVTSALNDVAPGRRRAVGSSRRSNTSSRRIDSGSDEESDKVREQSCLNRILSRRPVVRSKSTSMREDKLRLILTKLDVAMKYLFNGKLVVDEIKFYDGKLYQVLEKLHSQTSSLAPWPQKPSQSTEATEEENRVLARRFQNLSNAVSTWLDNQLIRNAMRDYDPSEYEELLESLKLQNEDKSQSLKQEQDALKMQLANCCLLIEYFTEDAEVSEAMIGINKTKYEELMKRVKDIYASL